MTQKNKQNASQKQSERTLQLRLFKEYIDSLPKKGFALAFHLLLEANEAHGIEGQKGAISEYQNLQLLLRLIENRVNNLQDSLVK
jgi:hypothetical protein